MAANPLRQEFGKTQYDGLLEERLLDGETNSPDKRKRLDPLLFSVSPRAALSSALLAHHADDHAQLTDERSGLRDLAACRS